MGKIFKTVELEQAVISEAAEFNAELYAQAKLLEDQWGKAPSAIREQVAAGKGPHKFAPRSESAIEFDISGPHGDIPLRLFKAPSGKPNGVFVYFHGGGFVFGNRSFQDPRMMEIAELANVDVIAVGYRLAPEYAYPKGADDSEAACRWVVEEGARSHGWTHFVVGGDSAGAAFALLSMIRLRSCGLQSKFDAMVLNAGWYDVSQCASIRNSTNRESVPTLRDMEMFAEHYLCEGGDATDPDVSPIYAELSDLPRALLVTGTRDIIIDDTLLLAGRLEMAGNDLEIDVYEGGEHVFQKFPIEMARICNKRIAEYIRLATVSA
ncbi:alpha/beta hydrolase [Rhodobacteraceae bacterium RKSG542]|uniref:alpha/beta hydrolase n=1 Tax=Pseudovibrio flavus TaxID=2529854 RepID=UPI0012BC46F3|nr:alpha/beta hydrolase [Pseudovibrio flavus]MTI18194.1 alpha/beta hydrolase [Pseudovibrio flavus]